MENNKTVHPELKELYELTEEINGREDADWELEKRYQALFNDAPYGIVFIHIPSLRYVDVNSKMIELLGYSKQEFKQMEIESDNGNNVISSELDERLRKKLAIERTEIFKKMARKEKVLVKDYITEYQRKDNSTIRLRMNIVFIQPNGQRYMVAFFEEV